MAVVACRVDRQIDAILHLSHPRVRVHRARVLQLPVQDLPVQDHPVHLVLIAMAHHLAVVPQVVVTHPIAARIQVDHLLHVEILPVHRHVQIPIVVNAVTVHATRDQVQIVQQVVHTETEIHVRHQTVVHRVIAQQVVHTETATPVHHHVQVQIVPIVHPVLTVTDQSVVMIVVHLVTVQHLPFHHRVLLFHAPELLVAPNGEQMKLGAHRLLAWEQKF